MNPMNYSTTPELTPEIQGPRLKRTLFFFLPVAIDIHKTVWTQDSLAIICTISSLNADQVYQFPG